jgi:hypothetical protein
VNYKNIVDIKLGKTIGHIFSSNFAGFKTVVSICRPDGTILFYFDFTGLKPLLYVSFLRNFSYQGERFLSGFF